MNAFFLRKSLMKKVGLWFIEDECTNVRSEASLFGFSVNPLPIFALGTSKKEEDFSTGPDNSNF
jgi:hypothetical protein